MCEIYNEQEKGMLTGLEDNILSFEWILVIVTDVTSEKKKLKLLFSLCCLALVLSFVMDTKR